MNYALRIGLIWMLGLLTACGTQSADAMLKSELQTIRSWEATVRMAGEAWVRGDVPTPYLRQTLTTAQDELQGALATLATAQELPEQRRATIMNQIQRPDRTVAQMLQASANRNDRAAMTGLLRQLAADEQALDALEQAVGAQR